MGCLDSNFLDELEQAEYILDRVCPERYHHLMLFSSFSYDLLILTILFLEAGVVWTTRVLIGR